MLKKKNKKQVTKITVECMSNTYDTFSVEIDVPDGGKFEIETIGGRLKIYDSDGDMVRLYDWQAGFTQNYSFEYRDG